MNSGSRFVELDKSSGEIVVSLPVSSIELRQTVMRELAEYAYKRPFTETTIDELDRIVTHILLENSHKVD